MRLGRLLGDEYFATSQIVKPKNTRLKNSQKKGKFKKKLNKRAETNPLLAQIKTKIPPCLYPTVVTITQLNGQATGKDITTELSPDEEEISDISATKKVKKNIIKPVNVLKSSCWGYRTE
ncbi:hypothetical protein JTB14_016549 [Gonioctena quinquepunctata]|nr:hypothetical protein JTB14_016549 [Gonioctena quinquepunctata]